MAIDNIVSSSASNKWYTFHLYVLFEWRQTQLLMFKFFWVLCHTELVTAIYTGLCCFSLTANKSFNHRTEDQNRALSLLFVLAQISPCVFNLLVSVWSASSFSLSSLPLLLGYTDKWEMLHLSIINSGFTNCLFVCLYWGFFVPWCVTFHCWQSFGRGGNGDADNELFCLVLWPIQSLCRPI